MWEVDRLGLGCCCECFSLKSLVCLWFGKLWEDDGCVDGVFGVDVYDLFGYGVVGFGDVIELFVEDDVVESCFFDLDKLIVVWKLRFELVYCLGSMLRCWNGFFVGLFGR